MPTESGPSLPLSLPFSPLGIHLLSLLGIRLSEDPESWGSAALPAWALPPVIGNTQILGFFPGS